MPDQPSRPDAPVATSLAGVFLVSTAVVALELALMRCLAIARWHNFAYLVISTALLGFGASGTVLTFAGAGLRKRFSAACAVLATLFAVSVMACLRAAEALPLDARYVLYSAHQAALMFLYHFLLFVPFLFGAVVIGLCLMHFEGRVRLVYGANLLGSGAGGMLAIGLMWLMPAVRLLDVAAGLALAAAALWTWSPAPGERRRARLSAIVILTGAALTALAAWRPPELRLDQYKMLSVLKRWEHDGMARHILTRDSPRARLDVYDSKLLHQTMFAGLTATAVAPPQLAILADGDLAATVFKIRNQDQAAILDFTPMSVPYRLFSGRRPRVLLLGEGGGVNVWLARRMGASHVTVVQANPQIVELMRGPLAAMGGDVLSGNDVTVEVAEPRVFLARTQEKFDVIQVVTTEGMAAGTSSLRSLNEDFLLTREGLGLCIEHLTEGGVVALTRGVQSPPRDNIKIFATLRGALEWCRIRDQRARLVQVRNYLAATTLACRSPVTDADCNALVRAAEELGLDVEWAPCPDVAYDRQTNQVEGPPGEPYSYFHYAALRILSNERERFFRDWAYNIRPATDDTPFFYNFFRWRSLPLLIKAYGKEWLRRAELGYVVLVFALIEVIAVGAVLILLPLLWLRRGRRTTAEERVRLRFRSTGAYFILLGLAYLMIEMVCLLKFTYFLGDPIYAAAGIISAFLVFSGLGSTLSSRFCPSAFRAIMVAAIGIALLVTFYATTLDAVFSALIGWPLAARFAASVALVAPLAFLMGWPFPNGLTLVEATARSLVPWAWGANGFASVAASPLALMIAIAAGFRAVLLFAGALYVLAAVASLRLAPRP